MINFRYHVVSLIAVFLSMGVGVLVGSSFIAENTVKALERSQANLGQRNDELREQVRELDRNNEMLGAFTESSLGALIRGQLQGKTVFVVGFESTDRNILTRTEESLIQAGANLEGSVILSSKLDLKAESRRQQVALAMEATSSEESSLRGQLIEILSGVLSGDRLGVLARMVDSDMAEMRNIPTPERTPPSALPSKGAGIVIVAPVPDESTEFESQLLIPLISTMGETGIALVVGESGSESLELVRLVRDSDAKASTADGIDESRGLVALVLGLREAFAGRTGHYGFGPGAQAPMPAPTS